MPEPPALHHKKYQGTDIPLSSAALIDLLSAVHEKGADFRFRAPGTSMYPTIRDGDLITLSPLNEYKPASGDIVAFRHPDSKKLVVHRIAKVSGDSFESRGDNCSEPDGNVSISDLLGVVTKVERNGRSLFWPDCRRFPRGARIFFIVGHGIMVFRKMCYAEGLKMIRYVRRSREDDLR